MRRRKVDLDQLGFLLGRAYYNYIGFLEHFIAEEGLDSYFKPGMGSLLSALYRRDGRTITELAAELQVAKSTMTGMVRRMSKANLITIELVDHDRRLGRIRLTPRAAALEGKFRRVTQRVERSLCQGLSKSEQQRLRKCLAQLTVTMTQHMNHHRLGSKRPGKRNSAD